MPVLKRACWRGIFLWQVEKRKSIPVMTSPGSRSLVRPLDDNAYTWLGVYRRETSSFTVHQ